MLIRIGQQFEIEVKRHSVYLRLFGFERFYNTEGLPAR